MVRWDGMPMDRDLQALMNDDLYGMWSNDPWEFEDGFREGSNGVSS